MTGHVNNCVPRFVSKAECQPGAAGLLERNFGWENGVFYMRCKASKRRRSRPALEESRTIEAKFRSFPRLKVWTVMHPALPRGVARPERVLGATSSRHEASAGSF